jgi:SAM-dependent methyltransferase
MAHPSWWLDELAYAGGDHLDADLVRGFDRRQGAEPDAAAAIDLDVLAAHGVGDDATLLDLGAGTGRFAVAAAARVRRVIAVEVSPAMLELLRGRTAELDAVEVVQAGLLTYEHAGPPVDAIHTRNVLHQLPDLWKVVALDRMAGWLRPGGVLRLRDLVFDVAPAEVGQTVDAWLANAPEDPTAGYTRADLEDHLRTEHSTFRWLLEPMLERTGFELVDVSGSAVFGAFTCVRR